MELYFGGAYNGKLNLVKETFDIDDNDIYFCKDEEIDFSKKVICGIHKFIYNEVISNRSALEYFINNIDGLRDKIIISDDLSSGIVPLKKEDRRWREENGRILQLLTKESNKVVRVFCGIPTVLKDE